MKRAIAVFVMLFVVCELILSSLFVYADDTTSGFVPLDRVPGGYKAIYTPLDLFLVRNDMSGKYILMADIDLTEALSEGGELYNTDGWVPLGYGGSANTPFSGIFDGNGHRISGLNRPLFYIINKDNSYYNYTRGVVQNLIIPSGTICGSSIAYSNGGDIINCHNYATITSGGKLGTGGIVQRNSGVIAYCSNWGDVVGDQDTGGIAGYNINSGHISTNLTVRMDCEITKTFNRGRIIGGNYTGGIIGRADGARLTDSFNAGEVRITASKKGGNGLIGKYEHNYGYRGILARLYNVGKVVFGEETLGYYPYSESTSLRTSSGTEFPIDVANNYYLSTTIMNTTTHHKFDAYPLLDVQMKIPESFVGFDFDNVWTMGTGDYPYPVLRSYVVHRHSPKHVSATESSCTVDGNIEYWKCEECGKFFSDGFCDYEIDITETVVKAGHTIENIIVEPTCTMSGYTKHICSRCGEDFGNDSYVIQLGHDIVTDSGSEPTCTNPGRESGSYCSRCGMIVNGASVIPALGHDYQSAVIDPTCTEQGYTIHSCSRCEDYYYDNYSSSLGHDYSYEITEPTCTEKGYTTHTCTRCSDEYTDSYVESLGHKWGDWTVIIEPSCDKDGFAMRFCSRCSESDRKELEKLGHNYTFTISDPTCEAQGFTTYCCTRCGDVYIGDYVKSLGHSFGEWTVKETPKCDEKGLIEGICARCGKIETREINALGHDYFDVVTAPTCTAQGYTTHTCSRCNDSFVDTYVSSLGHSFGDWIVMVAPICTEKGTEERVCSCCGETEMRDIDALGHSPAETVRENEKTATCTVDGSYDEVTYCSVCGTELSREAKVIPATGHVPATAVRENEKAANCTENGSYDEVVYCSVCGAELSRETKSIPATGHTFGADGKAEKCSVCGAKNPDYKPPVNFKDVKPGAYYADAVAWAVAKGVTTGTSATTFSPDEGCTRGQVVTFLWRAAGSPEPVGAKNPFRDVKSDAYYYKAVLWAVENGITSGTSATTFSPEDVCTRGQIVTFLWRANGKPSPSKTGNPFKDVKSGDYFYDAVLWAVEKGITLGTDATHFSPSDTCTRGQVVTFLYRDMAQ